MKLHDYKVLTFDCYGTLIDWETGLYDALALLYSKVDQNLAKDEVLTRYAKAEARVEHQQPNLPYTKLLQEVHRQVARDEGVEMAEDEHIAFGESVAEWPAFPDSAETLQYLKSNYRLVILSNVDNRGFAESQKRLGVEFDAVFTAEDIGSYKPSIRNFEYMLEKLKGMGIEESQILHTAQSLYHDMVPATVMGLARCWIDRRGGRRGSGATPPVYTQVSVDFRFDSLKAMAAAHEAEARLG